MPDSNFGPAMPDRSLQRPILFDVPSTPPPSKFLLQCETVAPRVTDRVLVSKVTWPSVGGDVATISSFPCPATQPCGWERSCGAPRTAPP